MVSKKNKNALRKSRAIKVRSKVKGTPERPRLSVYRSLTHIYAQVIDDVNGVTLVSSSTTNKELAKKLEGKTFIIPAKAGEAGKLFGSVTTADIAAVLNEQGYDVDKRKIEIPEPIKSVGCFEVVLKLHAHISVKIQLDVQGE